MYECSATLEIVDAPYPHTPYTHTHTSMGSGLLSLTIALFCVGGVALSYYAIHIEHMKSANKDYQATCDLDEKIACSKVVTSK